MRILGIHAGHGCGVALFEDGRCVYAASEERYCRKKIVFGFPKLALQDCMRHLRLNSREIHRVAFSVFDPPGTWRSLCYARYSRVRQAGWKSLLFFEYPNEEKPFYFKGWKALVLNLLAMTGVPALLGYFLPAWLGIRRKLGWRIPIDWVGHHDCHALAAAYYDGEPSPFSVVSEGYDGEASLKYDRFDEKLRPHRISTTRMPHSPGDFYNFVTLILGFNFHKHCGKITGLAAYGDSSRLVDKVRALMWEEAGQIRLSPQVSRMCAEYVMTQRLPRYFDGDQPKDIAAAFQRVLEETQVASFSRNVGCQPAHVCLSGGTFANVRLNQCFIEHPSVKSLFVFPAMSDEGQPTGAAISSIQRHDPAHWKPSRLEDVYLGPDFSEEEMGLSIRQANLQFRRSTAIEAEVARLLHEGKVVARFNGRMEFGPRALGNRSILARPTDPAVNDWLNKRLKRTEFMPFAPSVLDTAVDRLFTGDYLKGLYAAEFMTVTFSCTDWMKERCPAVVHLDGTARPQIVTRKSNPSYYRILEEYEKLSGLPVVINTSFNMHEEPIVCTPDDAIRAFCQGHLDVLAMGPFLVTQI